MILNKKAKRDYQIIKEYTAGIVLKGEEVKSVREGRMKLDTAYIKFLDKGPTLVNAFIAPYKHSSSENYDPTRSRQLLLSKREILEIKGKLTSARGLTVVPIACYNKGRYIKLKIALARGRKKFEKKSLEKEKTLKKEQEKEIKEVFKRG